MPAARLGHWSPDKLPANRALLRRLFVLVTGGLLVLLLRTPASQEGAYLLLNLLTLLFLGSLLILTLFWLHQVEQRHTEPPSCRLEYHLGALALALLLLLATLAYPAIFGSDEGDSSTPAASAPVSVNVSISERLREDAAGFSLSPWASGLAYLLVFSGIASGAYGIFKARGPAVFLGVTLSALGTLISLEPGISFELPDFTRQFNKFELISRQSAGTEFQELGWTIPFPSAKSKIDCDTLRHDEHGSPRLAFLQNPDIRGVILVGHSDHRPFRGQSRSVLNRNHKLALNRARTVAQCIENDHDVLFVLAAAPRHFGLTDDDLQEDRRVQIIGLIQHQDTDQKEDSPLAMLPTTTNPQLPGIGGGTSRGGGASR